MILCIDIGNTNTVLGCFEKNRIVGTIRLQTNAGETAAEIAVRLKGLLDFYGFEASEFSGAILSSVVPEVTEPFREAVNRLFSVRCMLVGPGIKTGLNVRIDDPGTLASDLLVGAVAAMNLYTLPVIIIDMGTAVTLTAVDAQKAYRGGVIFPGTRLSYKALSDSASLLPSISISAPKKCIGTNTVDAMRSGAVYGTAAMIDGTVARMEKELGAPCTVIATGGYASEIIPFCSREIEVDDDLLLKGLYLIYMKNV